MKIKISKTAGFCIGVRRAIEIIISSSSIKNINIYTYGSLIHNCQVRNCFLKKTIKIINKIGLKKNGIVIIRAHGISPDVEFKLLFSGYKVVNATCLHVIKVQKILKKQRNKKRTIIIIGNRNHPEIIGLVGCVDYKAHIVSNVMGFIRLPIFKNAIIIAQTTQSIKIYKTIKSIIIRNKLNYQIFNTICESTIYRQFEMRKMNKKVDIFIVVGGKDSGNTKRLKKMAVILKKTVLHIENEFEIPNQSYFKNNLFKKIYITSGASTPKWIIKKVHKKILN